MTDVLNNQVISELSKIEENLGEYSITYVDEDSSYGCGFSCYSECADECQGDCSWNCDYSASDD